MLEHFWAVLNIHWDSRTKISRNISTFSTLHILRQVCKSLSSIWGISVIEAGFGYTPDRILYEARVTHRNRCRGSHNSKIRQLLVPFHPSHGYDMLWLLFDSYTYYTCLNYSHAILVDWLLLPAFTGCHYCYSAYMIIIYYYYIWSP